MRPNPLRSSAGFTLVAALMVVVIMGIVLGASAQSWQMFMKREREEELLFRGTQMRDAIKRWYNPTLKAMPNAGVGGGAVAVRLAATTTRPLKDLNHLLRDPTAPETRKFLRRLYKDPITNKDFVTILDASQNIIGVRSSSEDPPVKVGNFQDDLKELADKRKYSEWQFVYRTVPLAAAVPSGVTGIPVTGQPTTGQPATGLSGTGP